MSARSTRGTYNHMPQPMQKRHAAYAWMQANRHKTGAARDTTHLCHVSRIRVRRVLSGHRGNSLCQAGWQVGKR